MSPLVLALWLHYAHAFWRPPAKSNQQIKEELKKATPNSVSSFLEACHDKKGHSMILEDVCFWCTCENAHKATCRAVAACERLAYKTQSLMLPKNHTRVSRSASFNHRNYDFPSVMSLKKGSDTPSNACSLPSKPYTIGCPPNDWCKGCTICDCQKSGKWDCNILSYCPEERSNKVKHLVPDFRKRTPRDLTISTTALRHMRGYSTQAPKKHALKRGLTSTYSKIPKLTLKSKLDYIDNKFNVVKNYTRLKKQLVYHKMHYRHPSKDLSLKNPSDQATHPNSVLNYAVQINTNANNLRPDQKLHKNCGNNNKTNEMFYKVKKRGIVNLGPKDFNNSHGKDSEYTPTKLNIMKREVLNITYNATKNMDSDSVSNKTRAKREVDSNAEETNNEDYTARNEMRVVHFVSDPSKPVQLYTLAQENKRLPIKLNYVNNTGDVKYYEYYGVNDNRNRRAHKKNRKNQNTIGSETCEPVVSSYSVGCPAEDWCSTGCTICDCTQKRVFNCYILSFCPDGKGGYFMIKQSTKHKPLNGDEKLISPSVESNPLLDPEPIVNTHIFYKPSRKFEPFVPTESAPEAKGTDKNCVNDTFILESEEEPATSYDKVTRNPYLLVTSANNEERATPRHPKLPERNYSKYYKSNVENFEDMILDNNYFMPNTLSIVTATKTPNRKNKKKKKTKNFEDYEKKSLFKVKNKKIRLDRQGHPKGKTYLNAHGVKNKRKELQKVRMKNKNIGKVANKTRIRSKRGVDKKTTTQGTSPDTVTEDESEDNLKSVE